MVEVGYLVAAQVSDQLLFHRAIRNVQEEYLHTGEFADDVVLLACSQ